jgi:hypothetical protein
LSETATAYPPKLADCVTSRYTFLVKTLFVCALLFALPLFADNWPQFGKDSQHSGQITVAGQNVTAIRAQVTVDTNSQAELSETGDLLAHYQAPIVDQQELYMEFKSGPYNGIHNWQTQSWGIKRYHFNGGSYVERWSFASDWKPVPYGSANRIPTGNGPFWEPVFHAALSGKFLYVPGAGGTIYKLNKLDGTVITRINPFGSGVNRNIYVAGVLTTNHGSIIYNAIQLTPQGPWDNNVRNSWLVRIDSLDHTAIVPYSTLTIGATPATASCELSFSSNALPWPPSASAIAPQTTCGSQRAALNLAPAIGPDGTIYTVSRAHFNDRYGYLIAVNANLTVKWIASLRDRVRDGCNVLIPANGSPGGCRAGATTGVDPATNNFPAGRVREESSGSPTIAPDGSIFLGVYTRYNFAQGHLFHFSRTGKFLNSYLFGWDSTPAIYKHDGTYSVVLKENHYGAGSYCSDPDACPSNRSGLYPNNPEVYYITQLSPQLQVEWRWRNTNTQSCQRQNGQVTCVNDHPESFEFCVNAVAIDRDGKVYANSEDGNIYVIQQGGQLLQNAFLNLALGSAYTPLSIGPDGKIYTQNFGELFVLGN